MVASMKDMIQSGGFKGESNAIPPYASDLEAIATLAGGIAHQFNNALVAIVGSIDLLQMDLCGNPEVEKYAKTMRSAVGKMTRLTDQLLAYARRGKYHPSFVSLNDVVEKVYPEIALGIASDIRLEKELSENLPKITADPTQLQMVLSALVENSKEAMEGPGYIRIRTSTEFSVGRSTDPRAICHACLQVSDTGKGMNEDIKGRMFEPFFTTKLVGRGLSMAAVYGIVKNHQGRIEVDSQPGIGTRVKILLPAATAETAS